MEGKEESGMEDSLPSKSLKERITKHTIIKTLVGTPWLGFVLILYIGSVIISTVFYEPTEWISNLLLFLPFLLTIVAAVSYWGTREYDPMVISSRVLLATILWFFTFTLFQLGGILRYTPKLFDDFMFFSCLIIFPILFVWLVGTPVNREIVGVGEFRRKPTLLFIIMGIIFYGIPIISLMGSLDLSILSSEAWTELLISSTLFPAIAEEVVLRGLIQGQIIRKTKSKLSGVVLSALIFGLGHILANIPSSEGDIIASLFSCFFYQFVAGLVFGGMIVVTGNIIAGSILHYMHNALVWLINLDTISNDFLNLQSGMHNLSLMISICLIVIARSRSTTEDDATELVS